MPLSTTGQEMPPPNPNSNQTNPQSTTLSRRLAIGVLFLLSLLLIRNIFSKNYTDETKSYLTRIGRSDEIDQVIPKTQADYEKEQLAQYNTFQNLVKNMSVVLQKLDKMEADIQYLKVSNNNTTRLSVPSKTAAVATTTNHLRSSTAVENSSRSRKKTNSRKRS